MIEYTQPMNEWEYRNITCRIYRMPEIAALGYIQFGDEWTQVIQRDDYEADIRANIESEVDRMIRQAVSDDDDDSWQPLNPLDDFDPNPGIDPYDPQPNPNPLDPNPDPNIGGPYWGLMLDTTSTRIADLVDSTTERFK